MKAEQPDFPIASDEFAGRRVFITGGTKGAGEAMAAEWGRRRMGTGRRRMGTVLVVLYSGFSAIGTFQFNGLVTE